MTNEVAMGYAKLAAKALKLSKVEIDFLINYMKSFMDTHSESEAERVYKKK